MTIVSLRQAAFEGIRQEFHCASSGGAHTVVETNEGTKNASVLIRPSSGSGGLTVFSLDVPSAGGSDSIYPYFNNSVPGLCQKCDAFAVFDDVNHSWIIALELKSTNLGSARAQINAGLCMAKFLAARLAALMSGGAKPIMIGAAVLAISPMVQKRAKPGMLNVRDIDGIRAAVVYDKAEIRVSELLQYMESNGLARAYSHS